MASIQKKYSKKEKTYIYYAVYRDQETGKQKWENCGTKAAAQKRVNAINHEQDSGTFIPPSPKTVRELCSDFLDIVAPAKWKATTYETNVGDLENYVLPFIGDMPIQKVDAVVVDKYLSDLQKSKPKKHKYRKPKTKTVTPRVVERSLTTITHIFNYAVRWNIIAKNPFIGATIPKYKPKERDIWRAEDISRAFECCTDAKLFIAMNLAFACSMRVGEILGLTWDKVHISDEEIATDSAYLEVDKELNRVRLDVMEKLDQKDVIKVFPPWKPDAVTRLVLLTPKTDFSIRTLWLPKTCALILREWKEKQDKLRHLLGSEYIDYGMVVAQENGKPCDMKLIEKSFNRLKAENDLPNVVFHSLRHSSATYKLKFSGGDIKYVQGETGHAEVDMVTKVYSHIPDEDRKVNAQKFEKMFYANPDLRNVAPQPEEKSGIDMATFMEQLQTNPEFLQTMAEVVAKLQAKEEPPKAET